MPSPRKKTIHVRMTDCQFVCDVEVGRETCSPYSDHLTPDSLLDPRVPDSIYVTLGEDGIAYVYTERPAVVKEPPFEKRYVTYDWDEEEDTYTILPGEGVEVTWRVDWIDIKCSSRSLMEYCVECLYSGDWETVEKKAVIRKLPYSEVSPRPVGRS